MGWQMALWERQAVAGRLLAPGRVLPYPGPALLSPEDKARPVSPRSWDRPALPGSSYLPRGWELPSAALAGPAIHFLSQQFSLSAVATKCPLVSKAPAWHPQRDRAGRAAAVEAMGWEKKLEEPLPPVLGARGRGHGLQASRASWAEHGGQRLTTASKNPQKEPGLSYST